MKKSKITGRSRISVFPVKKETPNEEVLQMIYKDLSKKIDFVKTLYPYSENSLFMYDIMYQIFDVDYKPVIGSATIDYFSDTFEESNKAFEDGIFNVKRSFFGGGEWPIILFDRIARVGGDRDWVSYTITR